MTERRALLVEDHSHTRIQLGETLKRAGLSVHSVATARSGLDLVRGLTWDLVVASHDLRGCSGLWLLQRVAELQPPSRRVLLVDTNGMQDLNIDSVSQVFEKPVLMTEFAHWLRGEFTR